MIDQAPGINGAPGDGLEHVIGHAHAKQHDAPYHVDVGVCQGIDHVAGAPVGAADGVQPGTDGRQYLQDAVYRADEEEQRRGHEELEQMVGPLWRRHHWLTTLVNGLQKVNGPSSQGYQSLSSRRSHGGSMKKARPHGRAFPGRIDEITCFRCSSPRHPQYLQSR